MTLGNRLTTGGLWQEEHEEIRRRHFEAVQFTATPMTDDTLDRIIKSPTIFAAWVLRSVVVELKARRQKADAMDRRAT